MKRTHLTFYALLTTVAGSTVCKELQNNSPQDTAYAALQAIKAPRQAANIPAILKADARFSSFVAALEKTDLISLFADRKFYTFFVPTNDACALMGQSWEDLFKPGNEEQLKTLIKNHIVHYRYPLEKLLIHPYFKTLSGNKITIAKDDAGALLNGSIHFVATDIKARCGVIHVIDAVIIPAVGPQAPVQDLPAIVEQ